MSAAVAIDPDAAAAAPDLAAALADAPFLPSRKTMGWTAMKQRQFLELVALGNSVETAAHIVQLSHQSAYAFRASARGAVFALGWRAALLLARDRLADTLLTRALEGQTVTITRDDGSEVHRHYHDNRLATATLTRLDRMAAGDAAGASAQGGASAADLHAARLAAQEWDTYLDLVEGDAGPARAALFVARRSTPDGREALALEPIAALARADLRLRTGVGDAAEVAIADLDPARRADWTAEQWVRAEAAGLLRLSPPSAPDPEPTDGNPQPPQHSAADDRPFAGCSVWWDDERSGWRTDFPPRPGFDGDEDGKVGGHDYCRELDAEEAAVVDAHEALIDAGWLTEATAGRDAWLAQARAELAADRAALGLPPEDGDDVAAAPLPCRRRPRQPKSTMIVTPPSQRETMYAYPHPGAGRRRHPRVGLRRRGLWPPPLRPAARRLCPI